MYGTDFLRKTKISLTYFEHTEVVHDVPIENYISISEDSLSD